LIQDILKNFKNKLSNRDIDLSLIYFEITDDNKIYNLETCDFISSEIDEEKFLKFKISTDSLLEIVEGKKHPEDLLFDEKVKISGDISILA
jgi:predicted lipid carrier protein YhbT|tara:strand:- start:103 stop:375 length:273 start_codon:yes stop_codon:yes gene_type:complete